MVRWLFYFQMWVCLYGCTDFVVEAQDGTLVHGRSLEFAMDLQTELNVAQRNLHFVSKAPKSQKGVEWSSKYGYLKATVLGKNFAMDGLNEMGLSFGYLWLPGTQYQEVPMSSPKKGLDFIDFGDWILGNFSTIDELRKALPEVFVWGHPLPPFPAMPPVHAAIHDRLGKHLVIEFLQGEMKIYDNPNTVLTNYPPFEWQLINLQNYIGLKAANAAPIEWKGMALSGSGQGSGFLGIPGDWTPPSRFVRMSTFLRFAKEAENSADAVNLAEHLLNTVDIPIGEIEEGEGKQDYTQWVVMKDLTHRIFYFRSYKDLTLKAIDLKKIDFKSKLKFSSIPIDLHQNYVEISISQ
jgi:choloylglycine hydrolase